MSLVPENSKMAETNASCSPSEEEEKEEVEESTSQWSEVIKNSDKIRREPFQQYLLKTEKEDLKEDGLVKRYTFGKKDSKKRNRTILMIGETGTGKSALINRMVNYMLGVKWEDKIRFQLIPEADKKSQTNSQTTAITVYEIFGLEELSLPFSLTVIDTPGYGDTRGLVEDKKIAENLFTLLSSVKGLQRIDAACLVVKSSQNRLSESQKYVFDAVLSLFGKNMEKNIMILITFSDWMTPTEALEAIIQSGVPLPRDENDDPVHFLFNNRSLQNYKEKDEKAYKSAWNTGTDYIKDFFQVLDEMETQSLKMTENVLVERRNLEAFIQSWEKQMEVLDMNETALEVNKQTLTEQKQTLEIHRKNIRESENFEVKEKIVVMDTITVRKPVTCCNTCKTVCHSPCTWASDLSHCHAMSSNMCTVCPGKCSYKVHTKSNMIYVPKHKEVTIVLANNSKTAQEAIAVLDKRMSNLEKDLKDVETEKTTLMDKCFQSVLQLEKQALKILSDATRQSILALIEKLKKEDPEKVEVLQNILEKRA